MISPRSLISNSSSPFTKPLGIVPSAPITVGITDTFMLLIFFLLQGLVSYLSFHFFVFILCSVGTAKSTILQVLFFSFVDYH